MALELSVETNGIRAHYLEWGDRQNPSVLCLHGSSGSAHVWDEVAPAISDQYRVICPDLRGHGDSDKPPTGYTPFDFLADVKGLADALQLAPFVLVGLSLGSRVGVLYGAEHGADLRGLVLVDPSFDMSEAVQAEFIRGVTDQPESFASVDEIVAHLKKRPMSSRHRSDEALRRHATVNTRHLPDGRLTWKYDRGAVVENLRHARLDLWPYAARIRVPTLLIRGAESHVATEASTQRMLETIPGSELIAVDNAIHGIPQDNPQGFLAALRPFLRRVIPTSASSAPSAGGR